LPRLPERLVMLPRLARGILRLAEWPRLNRIVRVLRLTEGTLLTRIVLPWLI
jgi:hypothetical protein